MIMNVHKRARRRSSTLLHPLRRRARSASTSRQRRYALLIASTILPLFVRGSVIKELIGQDLLGYMEERTDSRIFIASLKRRVRPFSRSTGPPHSQERRDQCAGRGFVQASRGNFVHNGPFAPALIVPRMYRTARNEAVADENNKHFIDALEKKKY